MVIMQNELVRQCVRIRLVEEKIINLYPSDLIQSPVHLSIGQEAAAVGVCAALSPQDKIFINYRGHAMYLARGGDLKKFFSELMGRETGICKGKGGSMHLADPTNGIMGASAVVGSTISHAVGAALANKIKNENSIFIANFGDGATEQGVVHECLNLAALHAVPVLFLCEDNDLAVHAGKNERQSYDLVTLVGAYGIQFTDIQKGNDPEEVFMKTSQIASYVRRIGKPSFLRINTARYLEHVGPNEDFNSGYRLESELKSWKATDPCFKYIEENPMEIDKIHGEIDEAVQFAMNSAVTPSSELMTDL